MTKTSTGEYFAVVRISLHGQTSVTSLADGHAIPPVSAATLLLLQGVNPRTVMELHGHSDVTMTLNTYSHVLASLKEDAARRMDTAPATNS